jgi:hypothetical protein
MKEVSESFRTRISHLIEETSQIFKHKAGLEFLNNAYDHDKILPSVEPLGKIYTTKYSLLVIRFNCKMYTSSDGQNYKIHDVFDPCYKCNASTLVCPHRAISKEPIALPNETTHIRLDNPSISMKTTFDSISYERFVREYIEFKKNEGTKNEFENPNVTPTFFKIWGEYYNNRSGHKPRTNRTFSIQKMLGLIQEIYNYRWIMEETKSISVDDPEMLKFPTFNVNYTFIIGIVLFGYARLVQYTRYWNESYSWYLSSLLLDFLINLEVEERANQVSRKSY